MEEHPAPFSVEEYKKMFASSPVMQSPRVKLLKFQFAQPEYKISAPAMAKAMGYKTFSAANLQYGSFARDLADSMGWTSRLGDACFFYVLSWYYEPNGKDRPYGVWQLHEEVVLALQELGWK